MDGWLGGLVGGNISNSAVKPTSNNYSKSRNIQYYCRVFTLKYKVPGEDSGIQGDRHANKNVDKNLIRTKNISFSLLGTIHLSQYLV